MPVFNAESCIVKCIESILEQTYGNVEVVIVNDGSMDRSSEICMEYASRYDNIVFLEQCNAGPSSARNRGIEASSGAYIQFVDSDDTIDPTMTEKLVRSIEQGSQISICRYNTFSNGEKVQKYQVKSPQFDGKMSRGEFALLLGAVIEAELLNSPCNKMYLSDIIKGNSITFIDSIELGEDLLFNLDYLNSVDEVGYVDERLYNYCIFNQNSLTKKKRKERMLETQQILLNKLLWFLTENSALNHQNVQSLAVLFLRIAMACIKNCVNTDNSSKSDAVDGIRSILKSELSCWVKKNLNERHIGAKNRLRLFILKCESIIVILAFFKLRVAIENAILIIRRETGR